MRSIPKIALLILAIVAFSFSNVKIKSLRVYVKYKNDIQEVKNICERYFPNLQILYVVADICRPELLVEIEGVAELS